MQQKGRRRDGRLRLGIPASLITLSGQPKATLCDISQTGARLHSDAPLKTGDAGVLKWLEYEAFGEIVWAKSGFVGIQFEEVLAENVLLKTRHMADYGMVPSDNEALYQAARKWSEGQRI